MLDRHLHQLGVRVGGAGSNAAVVGVHPDQRSEAAFDPAPGPNPALPLRVLEVEMDRLDAIDSHGASAKMET